MSRRSVVDADPVEVVVVVTLPVLLLVTRSESVVETVAILANVPEVVA